MSPDTKLPEDRVMAAELELIDQIQSNLDSRQMNRGDAVFLRAFKEEKQLELWIKPKNAEVFQLYKTFDICAASGKPGRKLKQGDYQVPEGFYHIDRFNPLSNFHLSLGINYPNEADLFFADKETPGGDIFIHGNCLSIGCLAMTDESIKEIYLLCDWARKAGQQKIEVHIFPFRMSAEKVENKAVHNEQKLHWNNLLEGYNFFEGHHAIPEVRIGETGRYVVMH